MLNYSIKGKRFNILRNIYNLDKACLKVDNVRTTSFDISIGVRQRCVLSPILFNIFLSDLAKKFQSLEGKLNMGDTSINSLFWANDLVLFADNEEN